MESFYRFADLDGDRPILYVEGYISPNEPWFDAQSRNFCSPSAFRDALKSCEGKLLTVIVDSQGGDLAAGLAMHESLKAHKGDIRLLIYRAYSSATLVALGVTKERRRISAGGSVLIHNPSSQAGGDWHDMESAKQYLLTCTHAAAAIYARELGITNEEALALMDAETAWSGQDAVDAGWASGLIAADDAQTVMHSRLQAAMAANVRTIQTALNRADEDKERANLIRLLEQYPTT